MHIANLKSFHNWKAKRAAAHMDFQNDSLPTKEILIACVVMVFIKTSGFIPVL